MKAGRLIKWNELQYRLRLQVTGSTTGLLNESVFDGQLECESASNLTTVQRDFLMEIVTTRVYDPSAGGIQPTSSTVIRFQVPAASISYENSLIYTNDCEITLKLTNYRQYLLDDGRLQVVIERCELDYPGGTQIFWTSDTSFEHLGYLLAPAAQRWTVPKLQCSIERGLVQGDFSGTLYTYDWTSHVEGGWRFRLGNDWYTLPVSLSIQSPPADDCNDITVQVPAISAHDTWSVSIDLARRYEKLTAVSAPPQHTLEWFNAAELTLMPNTNRKIERHEGYRALWRRTAIPAARHARVQNSVWHEGFSGDPPVVDCTDSKNDQIEAVPARSETLALVGPDPHSIEDPLNQTIYMPYSWSFDYSQNTEEFRSGRPYFILKSKSTTIAYPACVGSIPAHYDHSDDSMTYRNTIANPHWSFFYYFPPDSDTEHWKLGLPLTKVASDAYWIPLRTQYLHHAELSGSDGKAMRRNQVIDPVLQVSNLLSTHCRNQFLNVNSTWVGISRFEVDTPTLVSEIELDSSSEAGWTVSGATATFGTSIAVILTGTITILEYDLGRSDIPPYFYPHWSDQLKCFVESLLLVSANLSIISVDGTELVLGSADGSWLEIPASNDQHYAGSWSQSYAANLAGYTEVGTDRQADGMSSTVMATAEGRLLFELFRGGHTQKLRITIELSAPGTAIVHYPRFRQASERRTRAYPEAGHVHGIINDRNRFLRWGCLNLSGSSPTIREIHQSSNAYDYQRLRNWLWRGEDTLDFSTWFDSKEFTSESDVQIDTIAWPRSKIETLEPRFVIVNALREVPPLTWHPRRARDTDWNETGAHGAYAYAVAPCQHFLIHQRFGVDLVRVESDASRTVLTYPEASLGQWVVRAHETAVQNTEVMTRWDSTEVDFPQWRIAVQSGLRSDPDIARVTPFWGWTSVESSSRAGEWVSYDISSSGRHARAFVVDSTIWVGVANDVLGHDWHDVSTGLEGDQPCIRWSILQGGITRYWLAYTQGGSVRLRHGFENGGWSTMITVGTGQYPAMRIVRDGRMYLYWVRSGNIYVRAYSHLGSALTSESVAVSGVDDSPIAVDDYRTNEGRWRINLLYRVGGELRVATSENGFDFS